MSIRNISATSTRLLLQLKHDPATVAMVFFVPCMLLSVLKFVFIHNVMLYHSVAPMMVGVFPLVLMFVVASVATLRERTAGTLERIMTLPIAKSDLVFGYALAFSVVALFQAGVACFVMLEFLGVPVMGGTAPLLIGAVLAAFLGTATGLFLSAFAKSEFHAVQFLPAFILPQFLVCGILVSRDQMSQWLQWFADVMPLTYSVDAMKKITIESSWTLGLTKDFAIVIVFAIFSLILGAMTIRRHE